jgi:hypothetical protein
MTKKDYIAIAANLNKRICALDNRNYHAQCALTAVIDGMCEALKAENPRFCASKFRAACYRTEIDLIKSTAA